MYQVFFLLGKVLQINKLQHVTRINLFYFYLTYSYKKTNAISKSQFLYLQFTDVQVHQQEYWLVVHLYLLHLPLCLTSYPYHF